MLLVALAEVIGFRPAYLLASAAIVGLTASYGAAILHSWRRGGTIAALPIALYAILYVLLSLKAYSLLIGSLLLFCALATVMYFTRDVDWRSGQTGRRYFKKVFDRVGGPTSRDAVREGAMWLKDERLEDSLQTRASASCGR